MDALYAIRWGLAALTIMAILYDLGIMKIPNWLSLAVILLFPLGWWLSPADIPVLKHLAAFGIFLLAGMALFAFRILGGGDVKIFSALALWCGLELLPEFAMLVVLIGGAQSILIVLLRHFGPAIEYVLAKVGWVLPNWLEERGGLPYGLAIGLGFLIRFDDIPLFA